MIRLHLTKAQRGRYLALVSLGRSVDPDECWPWRGGRNSDGYGVFRAGRRLLLAHRIAYALAHGAPGRRVVRHECDNPSCVNPAHLLAGTQRDNVRDMIARGRAAWQR